MSTQNQ